MSRLPLVLTILIIPSLSLHWGVEDSKVPVLNVVHLQLIGSSSCYLCQQFLQNQLIKTHKMFYDSYRLNASYLPYTKCEMGKTKSLDCASDISALQACYMKEYSGPNLFEGLLAIQTSSTVSDALKTCCTGLNHQKLKTCATGEEGRQLLAQHRQEVLKLAYKLKIKRWTYPLIIVDGKHNADTLSLKNNLHYNLCTKFFKTPLPDVCE